MAFNLSVHEVVRVAYQSRSWFFLYAPANKPTTRQTSHANGFVNAKTKSHGREKPLLAASIALFLGQRARTASSKPLLYSSRGFSARLRVRARHPNRPPRMQERNFCAQGTPAGCSHKIATTPSSSLHTTQRGLCKAESSQAIT